MEVILKVTVEEKDNGLPVSLPSPEELMRRTADTMHYDTRGDSELGWLVTRVEVA